MNPIPRYAELAEWARANHFDRVTGPAIQHWVKKGLIPRVTVHHYGQRLRALSEPKRTGDQLLAVCRLRYDKKIRDLHQIAARLWFEGFDVTPSTVRKALTHLGDLSRAASAGAVLSERRGDGVVGGLEAIETFAEAATARSGTSLRRANLAIGLAEFASEALGLGQRPIDRDGLVEMAREAGLEGPTAASALLAAAAWWDPLAVALVIEMARDVDLAAARAFGRRVIADLDEADLPPAMQALDLELVGILAATALLVVSAHPAGRDALDANAHDLSKRRDGAPLLGDVGAVSLQMAR